MDRNVIGKVFYFSYSRNLISEETATQISKDTIKTKMEMKRIQLNTKASGYEIRLL